MIKFYKYKLRPNRKQRKDLENTLHICRDLFNLALEQRKSRRTHWVEQCQELTELKCEFPEYQAVHRHVLKNVLRRLHRSFENMWARGAGYPRFKSSKRYHSFQFDNTGYSLDGRYLKISKIGNVKLHLSRPIPAGAAIKTLTVKRTVNGWFACLAVDVPARPLPNSDQHIGIDLGIENLMALSDGTFIKNKRFYVEHQKELRRAERRVSRRKKGSKRRFKAVILLRKLHEHIANRRLDYAHKLSTELVRTYGVIVLENLRVKNMAKGMLAKHIHDAGWSQFVQLLKYKAEEAGRRVVMVDAKYTSQDCPACGNRKKKTLSERKHVCGCGYSAHRDTAAAQNILARMGPLDAKTGDVMPCLV